MKSSPRVPINWKGIFFFPETRVFVGKDSPCTPFLLVVSGTHILPLP